ncbi:penicillin-binding protein 1C [candidate division TA06 bacterium]|nr:penicillin-binding protein 1C [candidate division TA06 bacterium]
MIIFPTLYSLLGRIFFPLPLDRLYPPPSIIVLDRKERPLRFFTSSDEKWRIPASLSEVSPKLVKAVVTVEDRWFRFHYGVNPVSLVRAAITNWKAGKIVSGGSTLTMQIARMMEPKPRTIRSKMIEILRTIQLESTYSKNEILELYFNLAPYGGNIEGSAAASYFYFNKNQEDLTLGEATLLASIPNSPEAFRPDGRRGGVLPARFGQYGPSKGREKVLKRLLKRGVITQNEFKEALSEPVPHERFPIPFFAPHFSRELKSAFGRNPGQNRLVSTIDRDIQLLVKKILQNYMRPLKEQGISQGAIVVLDTRTREVLALVGSADFFDPEASGQVNGALAPRSPGSTLKPFVYALAMDRGLLSPQTLLQDVPVDYSGYRPLNYDERYRGVVTAEEALTHSLNVPAINLTAQLKEEGIYTFLKEAGVSTLPNPREFYGLSIILGGCEVNLLELTSLFSGLARMGEFAPPRVLLNQSSLRPKRLLHEGAAYIITEILTEVKRPDLPSTWKSAINLPKVAWKTGTSYGHKDAWSIGYSPRFTIGVWVGNFNGVGSPGLIGSEAAAPILFSLFNAIVGAYGNTPLQERWFVEPLSVEEREVCATSGMIPSPHCSDHKKELFIPGTSPHQTCTIHKPFIISRSEGQTLPYRLCSHCRIGHSYETVVYEIWPPEIATWMERNGMPLPKIPEHNPECIEVPSGRAPVIHSPSKNSEYIIRQGVDLQLQKILLEASVSNNIRKIYWFLNNQLVFQGDPTERVFITPIPGRHTLTCMDEEGHSTEMTLVIR